MDDDVHRYILEVDQTVSAVLEPAGFVGSYLHGSLALGSYYRPKSDIDLLFVVDQPLPLDRRHELWNELAALSDRRPTTGDIEASVLLKATAQQAGPPFLYEVHYSESMWAEAEDGVPPQSGLGGEDPDLAIHLAVVSSTGVTVSGEPANEVFAPIPENVYRAAVQEDIDWILAGRHIIETPFYGVLNLCRWLMQEANGWDRPTSKDAAGMWALEHTPPHLHQIVAQGLACYRSPEDVAPEERRTDGHDWDTVQLLKFRDHLRNLQ
ncbi:MAG: aminoglycoside adenylyltransferase domain-containing protein [Actinomycetota bacterium]